MAVLRIHAPVLGRQERVLEWDGRPLTVGRDESCDVVLLEQAASRHHARFERRGEAFVVTDLGSANGVWVGPTRIEGSRELRDGEVVRIGDTTLALVLDPHRQPTLYRPEGAARPSLGSAATVAQADAPPPAAAVPIPRDDLGSGPTLAADLPPQAPAPSPPATAAPPAAAAPAPVPPPFVPPRPSVPAPAPSSPSAYSLGSEPTLAAESGPNLLGLPERSSPSAYSLGSEPTLAAESGPNLLGLPDHSSPSTYSLGHEPSPAAHHGPDVLGALERSSPSAYSLGNEPAPGHRGPDVLGLPDRSSPSAYSLGDEPPPRSREPEAFGSHLPSSGSAYSLGHEALPQPRGPEAFAGGPSPHELGLHVASSGSVYLLGDAPVAEFRGPDVLPPAPSFEGAASSFELGAAPPRPGVPPAPLPAVPPALPSAPAPPRPPAFVMPPPAHSAASSWEWSEPVPEHHRRHGRPAGPTLWLGLGLLIGGVLAMIIALAAGYVPDLASLLGVAVDLGGKR